MTTVWPQMSESFCPISRAEISVAPPGGKGTMNLTGLVGHCACAVAATIRPASIASTLRNFISVSLDGSAYVPICGRLSDQILQCQRKHQTRDEREPARNCGQSFLPIPPGQEFERQQAQPAREMRGEEQHQSPLRKLDQRRIGPAQEPFQLRFTMDRLPKRPEVQ